MLRMLQAMEEGESSMRKTEVWMAVRWADVLVVKYLTVVRIKTERSCEVGKTMMTVQMSGGMQTGSRGTETPRSASCKLEELSLLGLIPARLHCDREIVWCISRIQAVKLFGETCRIGSSSGSGCTFRGCCDRILGRIHSGFRPRRPQIPRNAEIFSA